MERLIHIGLRHGYIVLETSRNGLIHIMDYSQTGVAVPYGINDYPDSEKVVYLIKCFVLIDHFFINTEKVLASSVNGTFDARLVNFGFDLLNDLVYIPFPLGFLFLYLMLKVIIRVGIKIFKA